MPKNWPSDRVSNAKRKPLVLVCDECAEEMGWVRASALSTYHDGYCDWCNFHKAVTEVLEWGRNGK